MLMEFIRYWPATLIAIGAISALCFHEIRRNGGL